MERLKKVMFVNALSSGATGLLLIVLSENIAELFKVSNGIPLVAVGAFLVAFACLVYYASRRSQAKPQGVKLVITLDIIWVLVSVLILITDAFRLSPVGNLAVSLVAIWVALMAYLQHRYLRDGSSNTKNLVNT